MADAKMSQKARTSHALKNVPSFVKNHSRQALSAIAMMCTIKASTLKTYSSKLRSIAMFMYAIDEADRQACGIAAVDPCLLERGDEFALAEAVANAMSAEGFEWFMGWSAENGLISIPQFRSALLKAQQIVGQKDEWAGSPRIITLAKGFEVRARQIHPGTLPVGAITEDMLTDLVQVMDHAEKDILARLAVAEFYGCFRISELLDMRVCDVKRRGFLSQRPKPRALRATEWAHRWTRN